jgi:hypothetical protein
MGTNRNIKNIIKKKHKQGQEDWDRTEKMLINRLGQSKNSFPKVIELQWEQTGTLKT